MWQNSQFSADLVTFIEEILNGKLHFCARRGNPDKTLSNKGGIFVEDITQKLFLMWSKTLVLKKHPGMEKSGKG